MKIKIPLIAPDYWEALNDEAFMRYTRSELVGDAQDYFPAKTPLLLLAGKVFQHNKRHGQRITTRFMWRGVGSITQAAEQFKVLQVWENSGQILQ